MHVFESELIPIIPNPGGSRFCVGLQHVYIYIYGLSHFSVHFMSIKGALSWGCFN